MDKQIRQYEVWSRDMKTLHGSFLCEIPLGGNTRANAPVDWGKAIGLNVVRISIVEVDLTKMKKLHGLDQTISTPSQEKTLDTCQVCGKSRKLSTHFNCW